MKALENINKKFGFKTKVEPKYLVGTLRKVWQHANVNPSELPQQEIRNLVDNYNGVESLSKILELSNISELSEDYILSEMLLLLDETDLNV